MNIHNTAWLTCELLILPYIIHCRSILPTLPLWRLHVSYSLAVHSYVMMGCVDLYIVSVVICNIVLLCCALFYSVSLQLYWTQYMYAYLCCTILWCFSFIANIVYSLLNRVPVATCEESRRVVWKHYKSIRIRIYVMHVCLPTRHNINWTANKSNQHINYSNAT